MESKMQLECMDNECRTIMFGYFSGGINCVRCGGPTIEKPYNPVKKQIEQNKNRELTQSNEKPLLQIVLSDINAVPVVFYKGQEVKGKVRISFDWKTNDQLGPYIHIEHVDDLTERINTKIIQHNHPIVDKE
ncbi:hypothetical protein ACO11K_001538 [Bacillus cytotoxicus]